MILVFIVASKVLSCSQGQLPSQRVEWRELSQQQQQQFITAVQCLKKAPSKVQGINSPSRYDDIAYVHSAAVVLAHDGNWFLPWHRAYVAAFEKILQTECNYQGNVPYWDWSVDSQNIGLSVIWNAFGGNGAGVDGCITSGPFSSWQSTFATGGCIRRSFGSGAAYSREAINRLIITAGASHSQFERAFEYGAHSGIHNCIFKSNAISDWRRYVDVKCCCE